MVQNASFEVLDFKIFRRTPLGHIIAIYDVDKLLQKIGAPLYVNSWIRHWYRWASVVDDEATWIT